jgi:outer membrane protein OmpA-like peptidoglycan-associated protein
MSEILRELEDQLDTEEAAELESMVPRGEAIAQPFGEEEWEQNVLCPIPTRTTLSGFPRYSSAVTSLPPSEQTRIRRIASRILRNLQPGCRPIVAVRLVGHDDYDPFAERREAGFMMRISRARALAVRQALERLINNRAISSRIAWDVRGMGPRQLAVLNPATEAGRRQNRRVEIWLSREMNAFEFEGPEALREDSDEQRRKAMAKRLQNTLVGRALAKMGAKISIEKAPPLHPAHWARGQSGFEVRCGGGQPQTNVVFGLFDEKKKSLAWYLFSSTVDAKSQRECKKKGAAPVVKSFGVDHGAAIALSRLSFKNEIGVEQLVSGTWYEEPLRDRFLRH